MSQQPAGVVGEPFARVLRASRDELNTRFAEARQRHPSLAGDDLMAFLANVVGPLISAVAAASPDRSDAVALSAYDIALELVGQRLVGPLARGAAIDATWRRVLPASAKLVAADPSRVLSSLSNAAHQVEATPGARVSAWVDDVARLAPSCESVEELLALGQVAAWRAGLAHFRQGAIAAAARLPQAVALRAVDAARGRGWAEIEAGLLASEWFDPARPDVTWANAGASSLRAAATVGAFRGFGGVFGAPPRVTHAAGHFHVTSADECWLLTADLYGATFHRVAPDEARLPRPLETPPSGVRLPDGPGVVTSVAASATTIAVTRSLTHHVILVPLR
jgi:hypothetical protein